MREIGVDIGRNKTQAVFDVWKSGQMFQYVISVCSEAEAQGCPIFPSLTTRLHWPFPDSSSFEGSDAAKLEQTRHVRDAIKAKIEEWCDQMCDRRMVGAEG